MQFRHTALVVLALGCIYLLSACEVKEGSTDRQMRASPTSGSKLEPRSADMRPVSYELFKVNEIGVTCVKLTQTSAISCIPNSQLASQIPP